MEEQQFNMLLFLLEREYKMKNNNKNKEYKSMSDLTINIINKIKIIELSIGILLATQCLVENILEEKRKENKNEF